MKGAGIQFDQRLWSDFDSEVSGVLEIALDDEKALLPVSIVRHNSKLKTASLEFSEMSIDIKRWIVALGYGNSDNLDWGVESRHRTPGIIGGIVSFLWMALRHAGDHLRYLLRSAVRLFSTAARVRLLR
jgi:hypothetical protein